MLHYAQHGVLAVLSLVNEMIEAGRVYYNDDKIKSTSQDAIDFRMIINTQMP